MPPSPLPQFLQTCKRALSNHHVTTVLSSPTVTLAAPRLFGTSNNPSLQKISSKNLPPRPKPPPEDEIEESFLKGSGPGGQKINKTSSAVQLKHIPTGLVVKSQATRSRTQNRAIARQLLADKLDDIARGTDSRSAVVGEVKRKKKASSAKKSRRKYRKLEEERAAVAGEAWDEDSPDVSEEAMPDEDETEPEPEPDGDGQESEIPNRRQQQPRV
ncbi:RF-1 domain-containing protein [Xylaria nigripes]|nr:RF-1 domain-containing protein [Xylaria nigripes]